MDALFSRMTKRYIPPMNRSVMEGRAVHELKRAEEFLDEQFRSISKGFPESVKYIGYRRCTSQEEYEQVTRLRSTRRNFDIANSSVYLVQYQFTFTDALGEIHPIVAYLNLPFVSRGGIVSISGAKYQIIPTLSDKVITSSNNSLFIRLAQDKKYISRIYVNYVRDNKRTASYSAFAVLHGAKEAKRANDRKNWPRTLLVHYLFGNYGVTATFMRYCNFIPVFGVGDAITEEKYPASEWIICRSTMERPLGMNERQHYPNRLRVAIPRDKWNTATEAFVAGLFYITDYFPTRFINVPLVEGSVNEEDSLRKMGPETKARMHEELHTALEDKGLWVVLVGLILFGTSKGEGVLYREMLEHFESLNNNLDDISMRKLGERGIIIQDYYDLLAYLAINMNTIINASAESSNSVFGMNLEILGYVLYDIIEKFTTMKFELVRSASRKNLTLKSVKSSFQQHMKPGLIFNIHNKDFSKVVAYSGDHMYPTITSVMVEQESKSGNRNRKKKSRTSVSDKHRIELSAITVGSVLNLPKSSPDPLSRINPWICIDDRTGTVIENPKLKDLIRENAPYFKF